MDKKLRVGVVGAARGSQMINVLAQHPYAELVAICDKHEPTIKKMDEWYNKDGRHIAFFKDFDDFIQYDMDAVVLANYAHQHAPFAIKAMRSGKHVLSEVLPCATMAEAVELIETTEETGLVYAYAENYCYMKAPFEMWIRYKKGEIGEVMYCEGEYVHDAADVWPQLTYGERDHWRNKIPSTFYCTHSIGPLLTITGLRPVSVVGFETPYEKDYVPMGAYKSAGIEMVTLENGAILKSVHGALKRNPQSLNWEVYGQKGMMESGRLPENKLLNVYKESDRICHGDWEKFEPEIEIGKEMREIVHEEGHGGSDFFSTHFFLEKIMGNPDGQWSIDVYQAVDMGICGLLAHRSILNGNKRIDIPNLRNKEERDLYRNDRACVFPEIAGDQVVPRTPNEVPYIPDEVYKHVEELWLAHKDGNGLHTTYRY